jgi:hypothetical protein
MGPPAQVWAKSDEGANSNLYVRLNFPAIALRGGIVQRAATPLAYVRQGTY